jgi:hypothetical protein
MQTDEVLQRTEAAVVAVESKLTELDKLHLQASKLADLIQQAHDSEAEILASDASESSKVNSLLRVRAQRDARSAGLTATRAEIGAVEQEVIALGAKASLWLGALKDALTAEAKARVGAQVKDLFIKQAHIELDRLLNYSLAVRAIDEMDPLFFISANVPISLASARKIRATFDTLAAAVKSVELSEVIAGETWS